MRTAGVWLGVVMQAVLVAALAGSLSSATGVADEKVVLGVGAGIAVNGDSPCTLTTIGHDGSGDLIGFTSAHCGGPGSAVESAGRTVGTVVATDTSLDYAVIKFDSAKVTPVADVDGFAINGVGPLPGIGQEVCEQSSATGHNCSYIGIGNVNPALVSVHGCRNPDDQGAPVTANDVLIGMIVNWGPLGAQPPLPCSFNVPPVHPYFYPHGIKIASVAAIIADVTAKGGPGAGFAPVPR